MVNPWVEHVKKYAKYKKISYGCAISKASKTYTKKNAVQIDKKTRDRTKNYITINTQVKK